MFKKVSNAATTQSKTATCAVVSCYLLIDAVSLVWPNLNTIRPGHYREPPGRRFAEDPIYGHPLHHINKMAILTFHTRKVRQKTSKMVGGPRDTLRGPDGLFSPDNMAQAHALFF